jgi:RNA polymerase sigma factor (sigma-70 family)
MPGRRAARITTGAAPDRRRDEVRRAAEDELDALMARLADGDRAAFDPLFRALYPLALRVASARVGPQRGEDVAQASLVKLFARADDFEPGRPVVPWLYAIVANEVRAVLRSPSRDQRPIDAAFDVASERDTEATIVEAELERALDDAIRALDASAAAAIAALLGRGPPPAISSTAFRKRISRAYARLRILLGGYR